MEKYLAGLAAATAALIMVYEMTRCSRVTSCPIPGHVDEAWAAVPVAPAEKPKISPMAGSDGGPHAAHRFGQVLVGFCEIVVFEARTDNYDRTDGVGKGPALDRWQTLGETTFPSLWPTRFTYIETRDPAAAMSGPDWFLDRHCQGPAPPAFEFVVFLASGTWVLSPHRFNQAILRFASEMKARAIPVASHVIHNHGGNGKTYAHEQFIVVHVPSWRALGRPKLGPPYGPGVVFPRFQVSNTSFHDGYTPLFLEAHPAGPRPPSQFRMPAGYGTELIAQAIEAELVVSNIPTSLREARIYTYPQSPVAKFLGWARGLYAHHPLRPLLDSIAKASPGDFATQLRGLCELEHRLTASLASSSTLDATLRAWGTATSTLTTTSFHTAHKGLGAADGEPTDIVKLLQLVGQPEAAKALSALSQSSSDHAAGAMKLSHRAKGLAAPAPRLVWILFNAGFDDCCESVGSWTRSRAAAARRPPLEDVLLQPSKITDLAISPDQKHQGRCEVPPACAHCSSQKKTVGLRKGCAEPACFNHVGHMDLDIQYAGTNERDYVHNDLRRALSEFKPSSPQSDTVFITVVGGGQGIFSLLDAVPSGSGRPPVLVFLDGLTSQLGYIRLLLELVAMSETSDSLIQRVFGRAPAGWDDGWVGRTPPNNGTYELQYTKIAGKPVPVLRGGVPVKASESQHEHFQKPLTAKESAFVAKTLSMLSPQAQGYYEHVMVRKFNQSQNTAALQCGNGPKEKQYSFTPSEVYSMRGKGHMHLHYGLFGLAKESYPKLRKKLLETKVYITDTNLQDAQQVKYVLGEIRQGLPGATPPDLIMHISNADDVKYPYIRSMRNVETALKEMSFDRTISKAMLLSTNYARLIDRAGTTKICVPANRRGDKCSGLLAVQD